MCGVRIDAAEEGYKFWYGIPTCQRRDWRYRLSLQKQGTRHRANIALTEISTVHVHALPNGLFRHIIHLDRYPERGLGATFWTGEGEQKADYYPRYMLARHFPDLLKHRLIVLDASRDYKRTFLILQQQATILVDHLRESTGNHEWRDPFSICHGGTSYNENSFDAAVATAATRKDDVGIGNGVSGPGMSGGSVSTGDDGGADGTGVSGPGVIEGSVSTGDDGGADGTGVSGPGVIGEATNTNAGTTTVKPNWTIVNEAGQTKSSMSSMFRRVARRNFRSYGRPCGKSPLLPDLFTQLRPISQ